MSIDYMRYVPFINYQTISIPLEKGGALNPFVNIKIQVTYLHFSVLPAHKNNPWSIFLDVDLVFYEVDGPQFFVCQRHHY